MCRKSKTDRRYAAIGIAVAALLVAGGCARSADKGERATVRAPARSANRNAGPPSADAFAPLVPAAADEVVGFERFGEMAAASDRVVAGRFVRFEPGRVLQGDSPEDVSYYIDGVFQVDQLIRGSGDPTVTIEFLSSAGNRDQVQSAIEALSKATGSGISVAFLHDKDGKGEEGLIRLTSFYGLVTATDRAPVDVPVGEVPPAGFPRTEVQNPSSTWKSMDDFIAAMKDI